MRNWFMIHENRKLKFLGNLPKLNEGVELVKSQDQYWPDNNKAPIIMIEALFRRICLSDRKLYYRLHFLHRLATVTLQPHFSQGHLPHLAHLQFLHWHWLHLAQVLMPPSQLHFLQPLQSHLVHRQPPQVSQIGHSVQVQLLHPHLVTPFSLAERLVKPRQMTVRMRGSIELSFGRCIIRFWIGCCFVPVPMNSPISGI